MYILLRRTLLALLCVLWAGRAITQPAILCEEAAQFAARKTGVPLSILQAVSLAETGHTRPDTSGFVAWPWAVMADMQGQWFPDQASAITFVKGLIEQGKSNIDIGCFQLNIRWHAQAFPNLEAMFSPQNNALYAATFLQNLYQETGDWRAAVGRYHSRDATRAEAYVRRLEVIFDQNRAHTGPAYNAPDTRFDTAQKVPQTRVATVYEKFGLVSARGPLLQTPTHIRPLIGGAP